MHVSPPFVLDPQYQAVADGKEPYTNKDRGKHLGCLGCLLFTLVGICPFLTLFVLTQLVQSWEDWAELASTGEQVQGTVTEKRIDSSGDSDAYYLTYCFEYIPADGDPRTECNTTTVGGRLYGGSELGGPIGVWYAPGDPSINQLNAPTIFVPVCLTIGVFGGIFFVGRWMYHTIRNGFKGLRIEKRLSGPGAQRIYGTITNISGEDDDGTYRVHLSYTFRTPDGRTLIVSTTIVRDDLNPANNPPGRLPVVGTPVVVVYADDTAFRAL